VELLRTLETSEEMGVLAMGVALKPDDQAASAGVESIRARLDKARKQLLDLSTRNRLIHTPLENARAKMIRVVDEVSAQKLPTIG